MSRIRAFTMPKWGIEMTEGTIAQWMVNPGDKFKRGDILCLIETAKITNEVEAEYDATVRRIIVAAGSDAEPVGALLAVFDEGAHSDAEIDAFIAAFQPAQGGLAIGAGREDAAPVAAAAASAPASTPAEKPAKRKIETNRPISPEALRLAEDEGVDISTIEGSGRGGRITHQDVVKALRGTNSSAPKGTAELVAETVAIYASPLARRIAALHGLSLDGVQGTGPRGRISKADVLAMVPQSSAAPSAVFVAGDNTPKVVPFDRIRKVVAQRLTAAKQDIPHFYLRMSANVEELLAMRKTANLILGCKASVNDWLVKAVATALVRHPDVNVQVHGQELHQFPHADISIAVASPKGLVTPVIRQADRMRIDQIAAETRRLIDKAQGKGLSLEDMEGGSFSLSNLGMFGIENFDAIINPPQGAILAVGGAMRQPVETEDGNIAFETRISFTMSVDHRAIDGAQGAQFLQTLKSLIEKPEGMFA